MLIELMRLYKSNVEFKIYVDKYAKIHRLILKNALKCVAVRNYAEYVIEEINNSRHQGRIRNEYLYSR